MKFTQQILARLVAPIIIGFLLIGLCALTIFFVKVPGEINAIQAQLEANEYLNFGGNAAGAAELVDNTFANFANQITAIATQTRNVLGLDGSAEDPPVPTASIYPSYFAGQLNGADPPLPPNPLDYSAYFNVNTTTLAQFNAMQPDITANLDNVFRAAVVNQPRIRGVQIGFPNGGWRVYPLVYNLVAFNPLDNTFCNGENVPAEFRGASGFRPQCRQYYIAAVTAYPPSQPGPANGLTTPVFTKPYPSAVTGQLLVSASVSLYKNRNFYGVVSLQILAASLASKLENTPVSPNGYIYVIEKNGNIVIYPQSKTSLDIYNADTTTSISAVEFNNNAALTTAFLNQVSKLKDANQTGTFQKGDGSQWTFAAASVKTTSHILVVVTPNSDISSSADSMKRSYVTLLATAVTITVIFTAITAYISYRVTNALARRIIDPVEKMVGKLNNIAHNQLGTDTEFDDQPLLSKELNNVNDNLKNLLTAVRFGNNAYYADDLILALENYLAAEKLMIQLKNERGEGVCANNLGNVYRRIEGRFDDAVAAYNRAYGIANNMLNAPNNSDETRFALRTVLANRLNNMGVMWKEHRVDGRLLAKDAEQAKSFLEWSLSLHRQNDNIEGIAQVSGNLGQLCLDQENIDQAAVLITEAFNMVRDRGDNSVAYQYACFNMGLLCEAQHKYVEAVTYYMYVLNKFNVVVTSIRKLVLKHLISLFEETDLKKGLNRPDLAASLRKTAEPVFGSLEGTGGAAAAGPKTFTMLNSLAGPKNVTFLLDTSGSMSGQFIITCRASITDIINTNCTTRDTISLIKFDHAYEPVFTEMTKASEKDHQKMLQFVEQNTHPRGGTAFYDALARTLENVAESSKAKGDKWIIGLTDGADGSPNKNQSMLIIQSVLHKNRDIGLLVITVGELYTEQEIRTMVAWAGQNKGMLIRSEANAGGIRDAFGRAVRIMEGRGDVNVETL